MSNCSCNNYDTGDLFNSQINSNSSNKCYQPIDFAQGQKINYGNSTPYPLRDMDSFKTQCLIANNSGRDLDRTIGGNMGVLREGIARGTVPLNMGTCDVGARSFQNSTNVPFDVQRPGPPRSCDCSDLEAFINTGTLIPDSTDPYADYTTNPHVSPIECTSATVAGSADGSIPINTVNGGDSICCGKKCEMFGRSKSFKKKVEKFCGDIGQQCKTPKGIGCCCGAGVLLVIIIVIILWWCLGSCCGKNCKANGAGVRYSTGRANGAGVNMSGGKTGRANGAGVRYSTGRANGAGVNMSGGNSKCQGKRCQVF